MSAVDERGEYLSPEQRRAEAEQAANSEAYVENLRREIARLARSSAPNRYAEETATDGGLQVLDAWYLGRMTWGDAYQCFLLEDGRFVAGENVSPSTFSVIRLPEHFSHDDHSGLLTQVRERYG